MGRAVQDRDAISIQVVMEANGFIIGIVIFAALALVAYLIFRNEKDKDDLDPFLKHDPKNDDDDELNDEK